MHVQLFGTCQPFPGLTVNSIVLQARPGPESGFAASATGVLANIPMAVAATIAKSNTSGTAVSLTLSASSVNVGALLKQLFGGDGLLPDFLFTFVSPIEFKTVLITYNNASSKAKFGIVAVPNLDAVPAFQVRCCAVPCCADMA